MSSAFLTLELSAGSSAGRLRVFAGSLTGAFAMGVILHASIPLRLPHPLGVRPHRKHHHRLVSSSQLQPVPHLPLLLLHLLLLLLLSPSAKESLAGFSLYNSSAMSFSFSCFSFLLTLSSLPLSSLLPSFLAL